MGRHRGKFDWHRHAHLTEWYAWINCCDLCRTRLKHTMWTFKVTGRTSATEFLDEVNSHQAEYGGTFPTMVGMRSLKLCHPCFKALSALIMWRPKDNLF